MNMYDERNERKQWDTGKYCVKFIDNNGSVFVVENDGGSGPMSTGTDEWTPSSNYDSFGKLMNYEKAQRIMLDPRIGYGGSRHIQGKRVLYRVILEELEVCNVDPNEIARKLEEKKQAAMNKLTAEEQKLLGLK